MCVFVLFAFPIRILLLFFHTNLAKTMQKITMGNEKKEREKSKGRLIVLLIQLSSVLFTHLTYCCEFTRSFFYGYYLQHILTFMSLIVLYLVVFAWKWFNLKSILNLLAALCVNVKWFVCDMAHQKGSQFLWIEENVYKCS